MSRPRRKLVSGFVVAGLVLTVVSVIVNQAPKQAAAATPNQLTIKYATTMPITRAVTQDQFATELATVSGGGATTLIALTSTTTGTGTAITPGTGVAAPVTITPGTTYSLLDKSPDPNGELPAYNKTVTCVDANGIQTGLPTNASWLPASFFTITPVAGSNITCTITQVTRVAPLTCSATTSGPSLTDYDQYMLAGDSHIVYGNYAASAAAVAAPLFGFNQVPAGVLIDALGISPGSSTRLAGGAYAVPRSPAAGAVPIYEVNATTWATSTFTGPTPVTAGGQFFAGAVAKNGIYYFAEVVAGEVDIYGFNTVTNTAIPGRIARLVGVTTIGDLAFDALGYLYFNTGTVLDRTTLVVPTTGVDSSLTFAKERDTVNSNPTPQALDGFDFDQWGGIGALTGRGAGAFTGYYPTSLFPTAGAGFDNNFPGGGVQNYDDMGSCDYAADVTLQKNITDRVAASDQFGLTIQGSFPTLTYPFLNFATGATSGATVGLQTAAGEVAGPVGTTNYSTSRIGYFYAVESALGTTNLSNYDVTFSCTDLNGGVVVAFVSPVVTSTQVTQLFQFNDPTVGGLTGENIVCTVTNVVAPTITITKVSVAETGAFSFIGTNGYPGQTITTTTSGVPVSASSVALATANVATTITEKTPPAGTSVSVSCTGLGTGTATASGNGVTLNAAAMASGNHVACTFTNSKRPTLTITKVSVGATGSFTFSGTNGYPGQTITTTTSGTPVTGAPLPLVVPGVATSITESTLGVNGYSVAATCTGLGTGTATLVGKVLTLSAAATAAGNNIACTFTNTLLPTIKITKVSVGGTGLFSFTGTNGYPGQTIATTTSGVAVSAPAVSLAAAGQLTTITETGPPAGYTVTATCTGVPAGSFSLSGNVLTLTAAATAAGNAIACTFTNTLSAATLSAAKVLSTVNGVTATAGQVVHAGDVLVYTITITNTSTADQPTVTVIDDLTDVLDDATFDSVSSNAGEVGNEIVWNGPLPVTTTPVIVTFTVTVGNPDPGNGTLGTQLNDVTTGGTCPGAATGCATSNKIVANPVPVLLSGGQTTLKSTTGLAFTGVDSQLLLITAGLLLGAGGLFLLVSGRRRKRV